MRRLSRLRHRQLSGLDYDERTGSVCDARCQANAHREREQARALTRRGVLG